MCDLNVWLVKICFLFLKSTTNKTVRPQENKFHSFSNQEEMTHREDYIGHEVPQSLVEWDGNEV